MDYMERVKKAAAPLQILGAHPVDLADIVAAAKKAAQVAAIAASDHSQNNKAYEKLNVPPFPRNGEMTNWVYTLSI
ncbi:MAG: hypothetical protein ACKPKO_26410, partial [Candidatus Fonsibacter sp.]